MLTWCVDVCLPVCVTVTLEDQLNIGYNYRIKEVEESWTKNKRSLNSPQSSDDEFTDQLQKWDVVVLGKTFIPLRLYSKKTHTHKQAME